MNLNLSKFTQSRINVALFRRLPSSVCYVYLQIIGKLYYAFRRREKRLIERNVTDMLVGRPPAFVKSVIRNTFKGIFAHYYEKMFSAYKNIEEIKRFMRRKVEIQNESVITDLLGRGKGVILVTAHWGAVEFIPWALGLRGLPVSVILECQTKGLEEALVDKAKQINAELISCSDNLSVFYRALQTLKRNRLLMTECDEVDTWRKRKSRTIELFGKTLYFDNTLDVLAHRSGAPVVGVFLKRVSSSRYTLICEPISTAPGREETARDALTLWQKYVTENPEQWYQWKKWRKMQVAS